MKQYLRMLSLLKDHRGFFAAAVTMMVIASFFETFQITLIVPIVDIVFTSKKVIIPNQENLPQFLQDIIGRVNSLDASMQTLMLIAGIFLSLIFLRNFLVFSYQFMMGDVSQRIMRDMRGRLYQKVLGLSLDYFSEKRTGELISRIANDVRYIDNALSYAVIDLVRQPTMMLFWTIMAFTIDPIAALLIFIIFPIIGYPMAMIGRRLKKIAKGTQEKNADINSHLLETISGVKVVKGFNNEEYERVRFVNHNQSFYKLQIKAIKRLVVLSPMTEIVGGIAGAGMMLFFGQKLISEEMSFGVFALFFACIMQMISPIKKLGNVNAIVQQSLAAYDRIEEILNTEATVKETAHPHKLEELKSSIKIDHVDFHYYEEAGLVLKDVSLEINKGDLVAIVGPTGTGKSTLVNLIPRFYDPTKGKVTFDGNDLKEVSFESLREQIGIVTQESILFNDTVKANIAYGHRKASQQEIEEAAKRAFAHRFIIEMPDKYDTKIGDQGFRLSGGEKQRISIARAILKNPPILILDEATSQLDSESEKFIQEALDKLMQGRTVIAIAHRLSTIMKADKIVVLEHGRIVGLGQHEELLKTCPLYKKLHTMQFQA